jgi:uncharacterized RDD family membrane protein YckC
MEQKIDENQWFYVSDNEQKGPVNESEILHLFKQSLLDGETMVWSKSLEGWEKASNHFQSYILPPPPSQGESTVHNVNVTSENDYPKGRPWIRYFAKMIDFTLYSICIVIYIVFFFPDAILEIPEIALTFLSLFICIFLDTLILYIFETTPGKAILKIKIKNINGGKINFTQALRRSFGVWVRGLGFGIPIISFICILVSYFDLRRNGITKWDQKSGLVTVHGTVGVFRVLLIGAAVISFIIWSYI